MTNYDEHIYPLGIYRQSYFFQLAVSHLRMVYGTILPIKN